MTHVITVYIISFFFFSSRRRHTRWNCDWSSDVCSSDLSSPQERATMKRARSSFACIGSVPAGRSRSQTSPYHSGSCSRSEEHTSELQSQFHLVCRFLLENKNILLIIRLVHCVLLTVSYL